MSVNKQHSLYIGKLPYLAKEEDLVAYFLPCGNIKSVRLSKAADGERNNGYAFVEFKSPEECEKAVDYCKRELFRGKHLEVLPLSSIQINDFEDNQRYLKPRTESELKDIIKQLDEIAKKNPMQAQSILEQNKNLLYALIEAECQLGMVTEAVPGMDILLESNE